MKVWFLTFRLIRQLFFLILACATADAASSTSYSDDIESIIQGKVEWIRSLGGMVSNDIEIRGGIFAKNSIAKDETLFVIPRIALLMGDVSSKNKRQRYHICSTVQNLLHQMKQPESSSAANTISTHAPYIDYLKTQPYGQIPSGWSRAGKLQLLKLLSQDEDDDHDKHLEQKKKNALPPMYPVSLIDDYHYLCGSRENDLQDDDDDDDPTLEEHAFILLFQRGWDHIMVPIYDMMNHRNGDHWLNSYQVDSIFNDKSPVVVKAKRDIVAGEQIYTSYTDCEYDCGNRNGDGQQYGAPEIFRDYGFVESYPQRWYFGDDVHFEIDQIVMEDSSTSSPTTKLKLTWRNDSEDDTKRPPNTEGLRRLMEQLKSLKEVGSHDLEMAVDEEIPLQELEAMRQFYDATVTAMELALEVSGFTKENCSETVQEQDPS